MIALVATLSNALVLAQLVSLREATDARGRSYQIVNGLDAFRAAMLNQETGLRGYLLSGDPAGLEPYRIGSAALDVAAKRLRDLVAGNPAQAARLTAAEETARDWQKTIAERVITLRPTRRRSLARWTRSTNKSLCCSRSSPMICAIPSRPSSVYRPC